MYSCAQPTKPICCFEVINGTTFNLSKLTEHLQTYFCELNNTDCESIFFVRRKQVRNHQEWVQNLDCLLRLHTFIAWSSSSYEIFITRAIEAAIM